MFRGAENRIKDKTRRTHMLLRPFALFLILMTAAAGCATHRPAKQTPAPVAPPLPKALSGRLLEYYPDASKRQHEQGRVVIDAEIGPSGVFEQPVSIDRAQTDAAPRLEEAASKILRNVKFDVGEGYKKRVTVSIAFELVPCGSIAQAASVDYRINLCLDPSPYANFNFAEHPPSELESKIEKILLRGDLADIDFLEVTLGARFRVTPPVPSPYPIYGDRDHSLHVLVTPTLVPKIFRVQGFEYRSRADTNAHTSTFNLNLPPFECPDIALWAARLKLPSTFSMDPHGYGQGADFQSGGEHGISVSAFNHTGGGCQLIVSQRKEMNEPFSSHTDRDLISPAPLVRGLGAIIASGDIRNVARAERALRTTFTTSGPGTFGFYYELKTLIPGIDPGYFEYSVNDTGQENASLFFYVPPKPANRTARLVLMIDVYHVCIRLGQLPSELHRRGIHFRHAAKDGEDHYVIKGNNEIRVQLQHFGDCVRDITLSQTTDVRHAIVPITQFPINQ
jgi:TonB family protein